MTEQPPAGWYPHPTMVGTQRYWDGTQWTDHIAPGTPASHVPPKTPAEIEKESHGLVVAGLVLAILLPIAGFIIGCVLLSRPRQVGMGVFTMLLAIFFTAIWYQILVRV